MTREAKRIIEFGHLETFKRLLEKFPNGEICHEDKPDFLIHTSGKIIGVEHTLLHKKQDDGKGSCGEVLPQVYESRQNEIVVMANKYAESIGMKELDIWLFFNNIEGLNKKDRFGFAKRIVERINKEPALEKTIELDDSFIPEDMALCKRVSVIMFKTVESGGKGSWHCIPDAGVALKDCKKIIQESIDEKEEKYLKYMENCSECWLLLVADMKPSSFIFPNQESLDFVYSSSFTKIYFMNCTKLELHELRTSKAELVL